MIFLAKGYLGSFCEVEHLRCRLEIERREVADVLIWNDHQVPARVWEQVQDDKGQSSSVKNQVLGVVLIVDDLAEYAGVLLFGRRYVSVAPGTPDMFHMRWFIDEASDSTCQDGAACPGMPDFQGPLSTRRLPAAGAAAT